MKSYKHTNAYFNYMHWLKETDHNIRNNKKFSDRADSKGIPYFECYFWDTEKELPGNDTNILYRPIAIVNLTHVPRVGMYLCFSNEVYVVTGVCISIRDFENMNIFSEYVVYDIEVERADKTTEL